MSTASSSSVRKAGEAVPDQFPAGLRVLVVDDDPTCLMILEKMLRICRYDGKLFNSKLCISCFLVMESLKSVLFTLFLKYPNAKLIVYWSL